MLLLPPTSTLFPYTTLFRSQLDASAHGVAIRFARADQFHADPIARLIPAIVAQQRGRAVQFVDDHIHVAVDRKSTRLNSSHMSISYAVFCLKKKNNIERRTA